MMILIVFGCLLTFAVGTAHDFLYTFLMGMGIDGGAGTPWDSTKEMWTITALLYFVCSLPPVLGIIIFALSVTKKQRRDDYWEAGQQYYQEE